MGNNIKISDSSTPEFVLSHTLLGIQTYNLQFPSLISSMQKKLIKIHIAVKIELFKVEHFLLVLYIAIGKCSA